MQAIGYSGQKSLDERDAFVLSESATPIPQGRDLLVRIKAIAINPVDSKIRQRASTVQHPPLILGWDASGMVEAIGDEVTEYRVGDEVFYAGDMTRPGCYASHQLVDERLVGFRHIAAGFVTLDDPRVEDFLDRCRKRGIVVEGFLREISDLVGKEVLYQDCPVGRFNQSDQCFDKCGLP